MPTLIIRDIPEVTYQRLKERAIAHRRSLSKEALLLLEQRTDPYDVPKVDWSKLPKIRLKGNPDLSPDALQAMIDKGRE